MRIELLGVSGVGKTTTLAAAERIRPRPHRWLTPGEVNELLGQKPSTADLGAAIDDPALRAFVEHCITTAATGRMRPSQKVAVLAILRRSCLDTATVDRLHTGRVIVHDELLLHRAFSLLPYALDLQSASRRFFELAPVPEAALVFRAEPGVILQRIAGRPSIPNVYRGLGEVELRDTITRCLEIAEIAVETLRERGVDVLVIDTTGDLAGGVSALTDFIVCQLHRTDMTDDATDLRERLLAASGSFRKKDGRHELRTRDVVYCAFSTPKFTIDPSDAQRDAGRRVARFGLTARNVAGRTVLDLGSNAGAMLFQLSNFRPSAGLGIEFDREKVDLATEIAAYADIRNLRFEQGDIDQLDPAEVGVHDIVLALAIEGHVNQPERLYRLLGTVTGDLLCFEGNSNCDMDDVRQRLAAAGFSEFVDLGFCDDDRDPRNNKRPQLLARKARSRTLLGRIRAAVAP